ncbi:MAG: hypothetical protein Kow0099_35520 [Candidatus Abyssubacteria bacterium]
MNMKCVVAMLAALMLAGCATPPVRTDLVSIKETPQQYKNKRIEITGKVLENSPPEGDEYRTWSFVVGGENTYRIRASEEGFNPSTIQKAYHLVEDARKVGGEVTVVGKLRVGPYQELETGMEIDLETVSYAGTAINTDKGPFVRNYYYYPYSYYPGPFFLHSGFHFHHHHW